MSLLLNPHPSFLLSPKYSHVKVTQNSRKPISPSFSKTPKFIFSIRSSSSDYSFNDPSKSETENPSFVDEWGEKSELEPEPALKFTGSDPPKDEDEWGGPGIELVNESPSEQVSVRVGEEEKEKGDDGRLWEMKRALVDTVYGSDFGFSASPEVRAKVHELVSQLEAANPTPAPTGCAELLDGRWILVYTTFSELLPLLAVGSIPLVKVEQISQSINTNTLTIENSITLSSPVSTLSFSASSSFEVQTPSRIQVEYKEGTFKPPEMKSNIELPESINILGQDISLSPIQQSLEPLENAVAGVARTLSGQPPLKIPIPGEQTKSWLLITYLDKDLRISRGDSGLFVLVREGSPLLDW